MSFFPRSGYEISFSDLVDLLCVKPNSTEMLLIIIAVHTYHSAVIQTNMEYHMMNSGSWFSGPMNVGKEHISFVLELVVRLPVLQQVLENQCLECKFHLSLHNLRILASILKVLLN